MLAFTRPSCPSTQQTHTGHHYLTSDVQSKRTKYVFCCVFLPLGLRGKCCQPAVCSEDAAPSSSHTLLHTHRNITVRIPYHSVVWRSLLIRIQQLRRNNVESCYWNVMSSVIFRVIFLLFSPNLVNNVNVNSALVYTGENSMSWRGQQSLSRL